MEIIKLNLIPSGATPVVHVKQYDIGRKWRFELYEGAAVYTLDGTEVLECDVKKLDGNIVTISVTNTSSTYVDIETTVQMTACSGDQIGALRITKGGDDIATINFILACQRSPLEGGITSDSAIHNLEQQIADAVADQYDADSVVFDNTPTAGHGVGFAVTSEGVATAVQDAKDYTDTAIGGLSIPENITDLDDVTITTPSNGEILVYNNGTWENQANPASTTNFAPDYDDTATYNTNDKVIYQGLLYVCLEDSVTGAWDGTKWQQISVADYTAELLPISSSDPTNTKDYIESSLTALYSLIHFTPYLSLGTYTYSGGKVIKNVNWSLECLVTASQNTWVTIGTITEAPSTTIKVPAIRTGDGTFAGMIEIQSLGLIRFYSKQALSSNAISFTASYST